MVKKLKAWIPQHIKNEKVLLFYEILRRLNMITKQRIKKNALMNQKLLCNSAEILKPEKYIENQAQWGKVQFGSFYKHNMKFSGCEIIATYNALMNLGEEVSGQTMVTLISNYEGDGAALNGNIGVSPNAIADFFKNSGYHVSLLTEKDRNIINNLGKRSDTTIVTVYNNQKDITAQVHTVSITREEDEKFSIHNSYHYNTRKGAYVSRGGYDTLQDAIDGISSNTSVISVIGIQRKF